MKFSNEQQTFIDALINKRVAEIKSKAEEKAKADIAAAAAVEARHKEHIATLETHLAELKKAGGAGNKLASLEARNAVLIERGKKKELLVACVELGAVNAEQVAVLIGPYIRTDDEGADLYVINQAGETRYGADGRPVSVKAVVAEFLENNPHMAKSKGQPGAGSQSPSRLPGNSGAMSRAAFERLSPESRMDYTLSGGIVKD